MRENFEGTLKGRVILRSGSDNPQGGFVGAAKLSNNNAEMQAIIEALLFLLAQVEEREQIIATREPVVIHSDSMYAVNIIRCGTRTKTNGLLRDFMVHLWEKVIITHDVRILWVRGHSKNWGNDMADKFAEEGADDAHDINNILENHGPWRPSDWGFDEFRKQLPEPFLQG